MAIDEPNHLVGSVSWPEGVKQPGGSRINIRLGVYAWMARDGEVEAIDRPSCIMDGRYQSLEAIDVHIDRVEALV